ncbi:MAG TPA: TolC family protein, partial [Gemmatimonadaceae bacterium]|nr:TolC family protein [Gemmatimonadaceae bacterium]
VARAGLARASGNRLISRSQGLPQLNGTAGYTKTLKSQFDIFANAPAPDPAAPKALCTPEISANATQAERDAALAQAATCSSGGGIDFSSAGFGAKNQWALGLNAGWNVFTGGRIAGQTRAATAQERSATIEVEAQRAQTKLDVAQAYYDAALTDRLVAIAEASLAQTELVLEQTKLGREVGDVSEFDLLRAQVTRDNQRPALIQARSNRDIAYLRLKQILEIPGDDSVTLATALETDSISSAMTVAATTAARLSAASRAPVRQLEEAVIAQEGLLRAAKAERMPQVQVVSGYQRLYFPNELFPDFGQARQNWTVGVQTSFPIFTAGRIRGSTLVAEANLDETRQRLLQTRELADLDTRVAVSQLEQAQAAFLASAGTAEQAQRALEIDQLRYREGISTQTDLAQSRILFEQATANRAVAARNLAVARLRVQLLTDLPLQPGGTTSVSIPRQQ